MEKSGAKVCANVNKFLLARRDAKICDGLNKVVLLVTLFFTSVKLTRREVVVGGRTCSSDALTTTLKS